MPARFSTRNPTLIRIAHSPDPDDRFMFWPLAKGWLSDPRFRFSFEQRDTAELNRLASSEQRPEICAVSAIHYARVASAYQPLLMGTSLGDGYGPVVVCPPGAEGEANLLLTPGRSTTAHAVLTLLGGMPAEVEEVPIVPMERVFTRLRETHESGRSVAALLIHEGRLVYSQRGLRLVCDLGKAWKARTGGSLPLGINVISRHLSLEIRQALSELLRESCRLALERRTEFVREEVAQGGNLGTAELEHYLDLYANQATLELSLEDRGAMEALMRDAYSAGLLGAVPLPEVDWI